MKTTLTVAIAISLILPLSAVTENWTSKEGKTAQLELVEVTGEGDTKAGVFKMPWPQLKHSKVEKFKKHSTTESMASHP